jgi:hypothetical protein
MNAPTLGYQEDTTLPKQEIARLQLVGAIDLFLQGKFICALTLAGAAEGVMAGLLAAQQRRSVVEESTSQISNLLATIGLQTVKPKKDTEYYNEWNKARNVVKHHGAKEPESVTLNSFDEAYWMLERALRNAELLGLSVANRDAYKNWVIANINM